VLPSYGKALGTQERMLTCCQALLSQLDFEHRGKPWASRIVRVLYGFEVRFFSINVQVFMSTAGKSLNNLSNLIHQHQEVGLKR